jgi:predicted RNase H-like HicB family nuclease
MKFLVVIEKTATGFSAYSPDLLGCVTTGATREDVERNMKAAIDLHLEGMREDGYEIPQPTSMATYVETAA